ncbi:MAG: hypothetical protein ABWY11_04905, partial [Umezawaea sp.]
MTKLITAADIDHPGGTETDHARGRYRAVRRNPTPAGTTGTVAAAIPTSGMTALGAIDHAR